MYDEPCFFCDEVSTGLLTLNEFDVEVAHGLDTYGEYPLHVCASCGILPKAPKFLDKAHTKILENIVGYKPYEKT